MIREATEKDEPKCLALWEAAGLTRSWNNPAFDFQRALSQQQMTAMIMETDGEIIGSLIVGDDGHRGAVYYVSTHPNHRGRGIARKLMTVAEDWLRARGCPKLNLMVREGNDQVIGFYQAIGYEIEERTVMAKRL